MVNDTNPGNDCKKATEEMIVLEAKRNLYVLLYERLQLKLPVLINENADKKLSEIVKKVDTMILKLCDSLGDLNLQDSQILETKALKFDLINIYNDICEYVSYWRYVSDVVNEDIFKKMYNENAENTPKLSNDMLLNDCYNFLEQIKNDEDSFILKSRLLQCIPAQITKAKLSDIITNALKSEFSMVSDDNCNAISNKYRQLFTPLSGGSGYSISGLKEMIDEFLSEKYLNMDREKLYEEIDNMNTRMSEIDEYFSILHSILNSLLILYYICLSVDDLTENDFSKKDLYMAVCDVINSMSQIPSEALIEKLTEETEACYDSYENSALKLKNLLEKNNHNLSEGDINLLKFEKNLSELFLSDIHDEAFAKVMEDSEPSADASYRDELASSFAHDFIEYSRQFSTKLRKSLYRNVLCQFAVFWSTNEIIAYISGILSSSSDPSLQLLVMDRVGRLFDDLGIFKAEDDDDETAKIHVHDEQCGCNRSH